MDAVKLVREPALLRRGPRWRPGPVRPSTAPSTPRAPPASWPAIIASGDRADALPPLTMPTLVIHGYDDTLINPSGGVRTAELVPGAKLLLLKDMGHDLPEPLWPFIVEVIAAHTRS